MTRRRTRHRSDPFAPRRRDRVLAALAVICFVGITGSLAMLALYADRLVAIREPHR